MTDTTYAIKEHPEHRFNFLHPGWGIQLLGSIRYPLWAAAVFAQFLTVLITWELWQVRIDPPNLPVFDVPEWSFGLWIVISLVFMLLDPMRGFVLHVAVIAIATLFDQFRMQPQILAIIFLMMAILSARGLLVCRWVLATMWLWAGIHKLLSPHWFAHASFWILQSLNIELESARELHFVFAAAVGLGEIVAGLLAMFRPRLASFVCLALHGSIFVLLLLINWNYSVLPWNASTAIIGFWVLRRIPESRSAIAVAGDRSRVLEFVAAAILLIVPAGFYFGLVNHAYAHVLYSDFVPRGLITGNDRLREIEGWDVVCAPIPHERRTLRQFFELVGSPGDKLHLLDPRPTLDDQFFVLSGDHRAVEISSAEFFQADGWQPAGIGRDDRRAKFWLSRWGVIRCRRYADEQGDRDENLVSFAYTMKPENYRAEAFLLLQGLPNLEQLQLSGCPVTDRDLAQIAKLKTLTGIGLNNTSITDDGLRHLAKLPRLQILELENTQTSPAGKSYLNTGAN